MSFNPKASSSQSFNQRRTISVAPKPFKPKAWTHQDELKSLIGKTVMIRFAEHYRHEIQGILRNADQFTLQLEMSTGVMVTYFKSAIRSFYEVK